MSDAPMPPGWYHGEGDPVGTKRYWDGSTWVGDPQAMMSDATDAPVAAGAGAVVGGKTVSSAGKRMGARVIDGIILIIVTVIISAILGGGAGLTSTEVNGTVIVAGILGAIFQFLWDALFISKMGGTPGKLMLGMEVVDVNTGQSPPEDPAGWKRAANRLLGIIPLLGGLVAFIIAVVSLVYLFTDDQRRTVMDRFGGTLVVDK